MLVRHRDGRLGAHTARPSDDADRAAGLCQADATPEANLAAIKAFNEKLEAMRNACLELEQTSRGPGAVRRL